MKATIEVHETAKTKAPEIEEVTAVYDRVRRRWCVVESWAVNAYPKRFPLWTSLKHLPKPPPLRKRKEGK